MITLHDVIVLRARVADWKSQGKRVALVPTMGNLHSGHISLVERAKELADVVVSTIFVNPMQFGEGEDFDSYPRTLEDDQLKLEAAGNDLLFAPPVEAVYPNGKAQQTTVSVPGVSSILCGASRPRHFDGVTTMVTKLFNMVQPDVALFGEKDYQQLYIIRRMTEELSMPIDIIGCPTQRESDGLAMSSRNGYLTTEERHIAPRIYQILTSSAESIQSGMPFADVQQQALNALGEAGFSPDYFEIRDADTLLEPVESSDALVLLVAARLGSTRLIDNLRI
ncbi:pantoate--beta-alanine ligase [Solemya velum gill symbiont]|uniref:pantoate--beta-alanine ligase n=1 Tax=Solemya velum gill symbiont TaxID=2340 RepID=UPI0009973A0E|nr:pantoate--beta-alanine ligase [Solemya velum gill symbiont]OOZ18215.1 pantoate--beta-alanine ligase [Solemya velum gill symbiont]OOZ27675.1 pantoate--beta-alanine ligase [Solemya velum gill symbiont]